MSGTKNKQSQGERLSFPLINRRLNCWTPLIWLQETSGEKTAAMSKLQSWKNFQAEVSPCSKAPCARILWKLTGDDVSEAWNWDVHQFWINLSKLKSCQCGIYHGTIMSHLWKGKIIFNSALVRDMLVPRTLIIQESWFICSIASGFMSLQLLVFFQKLLEIT